jgi:hypothetical protein
MKRIMSVELEYCGTHCRFFRRPPVVPAADLPGEHFNLICERNGKPIDWPVIVKATFPEHCELEPAEK